MSLMLAAVLAATMTYSASVTRSVIPALSAAELSVESDVPAASEAAPALALADERFLRAADEDNRAALAAFKMLAERGEDAGLRDFARRAAELRHRVQENLEVLAIRKDVVLTIPPERTAHVSLRLLARLTGSAFDEAWLRRYGSLNQRSYERYAAGRRRSRDQEVRDFAWGQLQWLRETVPTAGLAVTPRTAALVPNATRCESPLASDQSVTTSLRLRCTR